jgi:hypothetical protein
VRGLPNAIGVEPRRELAAKSLGDQLDELDRRAADGLEFHRHARVVNAIDWICRAPKGLIAVEDVPQAEVIRGLMW